MMQAYLNYNFFVPEHLHQVPFPYALKSYGGDTHLFEEKIINTWEVDLASVINRIKYKD